MIFGAPFLYLLCIAAFFVVVIAFNPKESSPIRQLDSKGVINLDGLTYNKLIPSEKFAYLILIYQKSSVGDYGTESLRSDYYAFAKKAQTEGESDNIVFAQIVVNGADNLNLATRLGLKKDFEHPHLVLIQKGETKAIPYPSGSPFRLYELSVFASKYSDFYMKQAGRTKLLNNLRKAFFDAQSKSERDQIIASAESELVTLANIEKLDAEYHIGILRKINEDGYHIANEEIKKLNSLISKATPADKRIHELRLDVLFEIKNIIDSREL